MDPATEPADSTLHDTEGGDAEEGIDFRPSLPPEEREAAAGGLRSRFAAFQALVRSREVPYIPISRVTGAPAELATLFGKLADAETESDRIAEREACISIARMLASRGTDLETATFVARRALALGEDLALRSELGGWLAGLGEPTLAAATLRPLCVPTRDTPEDRAIAAKSLVHVALLLARGGDGEGAADSLREAAELSNLNPVPLELFATLAMWAPSAVSEEEAAVAYLDAAKRRLGVHDKDGAFEDRLRALEMAPHLAGAARAVSEALIEQGRLAAADEVMRGHARALEALDPEGARQVHVARMATATARSDAVSALGAVLDAGLELDVTSEEAARIDELCAQLGLFELYATRMELRAASLTGAPRAEIYEALASIYMGPLASPDRAIDAWIHAAESSATATAARGALRDQAARSDDFDPQIEALLRLVLAPPPGTDNAGRVTVLKELAAVAEEILEDAALGHFAWSGIRALGASEEEASLALDRLTPATRDGEEAIAQAQRALEGAQDTAGRVSALRRLDKLYKSRPDRHAQHVEVLAALVRAHPSEPGPARALDRLMDRRPNGAAPGRALTELYDSVLEARATAAAESPELVRARLARARLAAAEGRHDQALEHVTLLLVEAPSSGAGAAGVLIAASRAGRRKERAEALASIAGSAAAEVRALLLSVAAVEYMELGLRDRARIVAEQAFQADPNSARAALVLADALADQDDRFAAATLERAMTMVVPRASMCDRLGRILEGSGEYELAVAWTQRWLALRPGDRYAIAAFVRRAALARSATRLADALKYVLAQPEPLGDVRDLGDRTETISEHVDGWGRGPAGEGGAKPPSTSIVHLFVEALTSLFDLAPDRALAIGRRAIDVFGPRVPPLRDRLVQLADRIGDPALAVAALERWVASDPTVPPSELLGLSRRRSAARDLDGAARELARAAEQGAEPDQVLAHADRLEDTAEERNRPLSSDSILFLAEARARSLGAMHPPEAFPRSSRNPKPEDEAARVHRAEVAVWWRRLGALRWDLAGDWRGAEQAFFAASEYSEEVGVQHYVRDLCAYAGVDDALEALWERACISEEADPRLRARLLLQVALLALDRGQKRRALEAASAAIDLDPSRSDALALVEQASQDEKETTILNQSYGRLASAALGVYGRRAAHYRAARELENRGEVMLALRHAVSGFAAVPSEGTPYHMLLRLAKKSGSTAEAVRALLEVAESGYVGNRIVWLKRAAALSDDTTDGAQMRFDILLKALHLSPSADVVELLGNASRRLADLTGEPELVDVRFSRAMTEALPRLVGPDGARTAVFVARAALVSVDSKTLALSAVERALKIDGDIDEFDALVPLAGLLSEETELAKNLLEQIQAGAKSPHTSVGSGLLRFACALAQCLGDDAAQIQCNDLLRARGGTESTRTPENTELFAQPPSGDRFDLDIPSVPGGAPEVAAGAAQARAAEAAAAEAAATEAAAAEAAAAEAAAVAPRLSSPTAPPRPSPPPITTKSEDAADELVEVSASDLLLPGASRPPPRRDSAPPSIRPSVRPSAPLSLSLSRAGAGAGVGDDASPPPPSIREVGYPSDRPPNSWSGLKLLELQEPEGPSDAATEAVATEERAAQVRGDHDAVAALLKKRIELTRDDDTRRVLRLRRAAVLEQRHGRLEEAAEELEHVLLDHPRDKSALPFLADLYERLAATTHAAPLWLRIAELESDPDDRAKFGARASKGFLAMDDVARAERALELAGPALPRRESLVLTADLARRKGDLARAVSLLEEAAAEAALPATRRAELLLEASRLQLQLNDDAGALSRARRARDVAPKHTSAVLEVTRLEYRARGTGTPREAQAVVDVLIALSEGTIEEAQRELLTFLLAEELDVIQGGGAGMRELSRLHAELGPRPLIALGMAERLVRSKSFEGAVALFQKALDGDLQGLRPRGRVALAAADAAAQSGALEQAERFVAVALEEPDSRANALRKQLELRGLHGEPEQAKPALEELIQISTGLLKARALARLASFVAKGDPVKALAFLEQAVPLARSDKAFTLRLSQDIDELRAAIDDGDLLHNQTPTKPSRPPPKFADTDAHAGASSGDPAASEKPASAAKDAAPVSSEQAERAHGGTPKRLSGSLPPLRMRRKPTPMSARELLPADDDDEPLPSRPPPASSAPAPPENSSSPLLPLGPTPPPLPPAPPTLPALPPPLPVPTLAKPAAPPAPASASSTPASSPPTASTDPSTPPSRPQPPPLPSEPSEPARPPPLPRAPPPRDSYGGTAGPVSARSEASASHRLDIRATEEGTLMAELLAGSFEAGERLVELFEQKPQGRTGDLLAVRRQQLVLRPGRRELLDLTIRAANADSNVTYARAIEHVLRAFDPTATPLVPPPLAVQVQGGELTQSLLFRNVVSAVHEVLAIAWETGIFKRETSQYGLMGSERVQTGVATPLTEAYVAVGKAIGLSIPLFHRKSNEALEVRTALLSPPAMIVSGEVREESPELLYVLGAGHVACMAEHVLVSGLVEDRARQVLMALLAAFGPVEETRELSTRSPEKIELARLEAQLWQLVPPRSERRLRDLCQDVKSMSYDLALEGTRQAMRRAGLFACGNIASAVQMTLQELGVDLPLDPPEGLAEACSAYPDIADLVRLATRMEYAEARWALPTSAPHTRRISGRNGAARPPGIE